MANQAHRGDEGFGIFRVQLQVHRVDIGEASAKRFKDRFGMTSGMGAGTKSTGAKPEETPAKGAAKKK